MQSQPQQNKEKSTLYTLEKNSKNDGKILFTWSECKAISSEREGLTWRCFYYK
jgi:hypothetical protein